MEFKDIDQGRAFFKISLIVVVLLLPTLAESDDAIAQAIHVDVRMDSFQLMPGESQTREMVISISGVSEVAVNSISFQDGELMQWFAVDKEVPFIVQGDMGSDAMVTIPITVSVPPNYSGEQERFAVINTDLEYELGGQVNAHTVIQRFELLIMQQQEAWMLPLGIGIAIAAAGAIYGMYRQRRKN